MSNASEARAFPPSPGRGPAPNQNPDSLQTRTKPCPEPETRRYIPWGLAAGSGYVVAVLSNERDAKLLDGLKMMGLSPMASMFGWWLTYIPIFTVGTTLMTLIIGLVGIFPNESLLPLWITLELFVVAMIAASFLVASVVSKPSAAQGIATLAYISGFALFGVLLALRRLR